ncbi:MAG: NAD(P)-dependent glycerol-3-phosphate dehydrogenase [Deltaproteobacteria bacterium]|nr:NAD(P)-dependent glycerol-3-phosphate dehydrogenase [Deltaproteobacteria bacterium]
MPENVGVIGSGSWGTTIAKILGENGNQVLLWARRQALCDQINEVHVNEDYLPGAKLPPELMATTDLEHICASCKLIVMVVPSHGFRQVAHEIGGFLDGEHIIIHATKGIEAGTSKRMSEILREETPVRKLGVLSGPNLAKELAVRKPAGTLVASRYKEVVERAQATLHNDYFRVYGGDDVIGAEIGGTFKNIVAVAAGIADGLEFGDNTKALLVTRGINEMARFGLAMGADVLTFGGMAGFGDMMATCASPFSRNHQVGVRLARGETLDEILAAMKMVAEGVKATKAVRAFCDGHGLSLPIVNAVFEVLYEGAEVGAALGRLMHQAIGHEFQGFQL